IGVGAILGAPLMLSTLSISLLAFAVLKNRKMHGHFHPERTGLKRDLNFFISAFAFATIALFVPHEVREIRYAIGFAMVMIYFIYILLTLRASKDLVADGHATEAESPMFICRLGLPNNMSVVMLQLLLGLAMLIGGAKGFISGIQQASELLGISPLLLSLLVIPIATELPEKVNSILWVRRGKDTLAFGNITGALVFQGTLLPAIGIMLTPWVPQKEVFAGVVITLLGVLWLRWMISRGQLRVWHVWVNGLLYISYLALVLK
ncbi:MAG: sodium:calcium antiporter, partial [Methylophilaceae bacterium]|nr:sodium:calcium antiporter [Methylophilaceae bacterium]